MGCCGPEKEALLHAQTLDHRPPPLGRPVAKEAERALSRSYPAVPESLSLIRQSLVGFGQESGASTGTVEAIRLVSSEAAANVVAHAYDAEPGCIHITAMCDTQAIWVVVADDGHGLTADRERPGLGVGFPWMALFSDAMTVDSRPSGGLQVSLRFDR